MTTKAGVWIDHKKAIVVLFTDAGPVIKKIAFDVGQSVRPAGTSRTKKQYTPDDFVAEDTLERKVENVRKLYFDDVIAAIRGADALLILGPGEAKGEFSKHIKTKKIRGVAVELETADKMTDRQVAAKVKQHFTTIPAKKSVAPKKTAKKKVAINNSKKPTKKSKK